MKRRVDRHTFLAAPRPFIHSISPEGKVPETIACTLVEGICERFKQLEITGMKMSQDGNSCLNIRVATSMNRNFVLVRSTSSECMSVAAIVSIQQSPELPAYIFGTINNAASAPGIPQRDGTSTPSRQSSRTAHRPCQKEPSPSDGSCSIRQKSSLLHPSDQSGN